LPTASASTVNMDAILAILNFLLRPPFISVNLQSCHLLFPDTYY
jgi:hypothetical protein